MVRRLDTYEEFDAMLVEALNEVLPDLFMAECTMHNTGCICLGVGPGRLHFTTLERSSMFNNLTTLKSGMRSIHEGRFSDAILGIESAVSYERSSGNDAFVLD